MPAADLEGPLADFLERTRQAREIMAVVESAGKNTTALTTVRTGIDLSRISIETGNTVNSMALIFLAAGFEEFVREEAAQCGNYLIERYAALPDPDRYAIRDAYWSVTKDRLKFERSILTKKIPDPALIGKIRSNLDALSGFVVNDDASKIANSTFGHHTNNFRPDVVAEIFARLRVKSLLDQICESTKLKSHFGTTKKAECQSMLTAKWNEFYDRRNETVHSLGGTSGFAVDVVISYAKMLELTAESLKIVLGKHLATW